MDDIHNLFAEETNEKGFGWKSVLSPKVTRSNPVLLVLVLVSFLDESFFPARSKLLFVATTPLHNSRV
jgi:hypothetical protein